MNTRLIAIAGCVLVGTALAAIVVKMNQSGPAPIADAPAIPMVDSTALPATQPTIAMVAPAPSPVDVPAAAPVDQASPVEKPIAAEPPAPKQSKQKQQGQQKGKHARGNNPSAAPTPAQEKPIERQALSLV